VRREETERAKKYGDSAETKGVQGDRESSERQRVKRATVSEETERRGETERVHRDRETKDRQRE
jgi:hypothetical protein